MEASNMSFRFPVKYGMIPIDSKLLNKMYLTRARVNELDNK